MFMAEIDDVVVDTLDSLSINAIMINATTEINIAAKTGNISL